MRSDLVESGIEFLPTYEQNMFLSASQIENSKFISCDDDGVVTLQLFDGQTQLVDSIDLEYINE